MDWEQAVVGTVGNGAIGTDLGDRLDRLLRGELSAVEAYRKVIETFEKDVQERSLLDQMRAEHEENVSFLKEMVRHEGQEPSPDSGAWGTFVSALLGVGKAFGPQVALATLREGEERGLESYETLLLQEEFRGDDRQIVQFKLIPRQERHIETLALMASRH